MSERSSVTRRLAALGTLVLVWASVAAGRQFYLGSSAIHRSDEALAVGDMRASLEAARRAAEAVAPGSRYPALGYARLRNIGKDAEAKNDVALARNAWSQMEGAAISSDHPLASTAAQRREAETHLVDLEALRNGGGDGRPYKEALQRESPSPVRGLVLFGLSAAGFLATAFFVLRRGTAVRVLGATALGVLAYAAGSLFG